MAVRYGGLEEFMKLAWVLGPKLSAVLGSAVLHSPLWELQELKPEAVKAFVGECSECRAKLG